MVKISVRNIVSNKNITLICLFLLKPVEDYQLAKPTSTLL